MNINTMGKYNTEIRAQADRIPLLWEGAKGRSTYQELKQVPVRKLHDIQIKGSACHFFHTQSKSVVMKEFLKPF